MDLLNDILELVPPEWEHDSYISKRFALFDVDKSSEEYTSVVNEYIPSRKVITLQRVQHPYAYGCFNIRKEQLQKQRCGVTVKRVFEDIQADIEAVKIYLDFNCDNRRKKVSMNGNYYTVVKKVLSITQNRDTDYYPEYLIQYERQYLLPSTI